MRCLSAGLLSSAGKLEDEGDFLVIFLEKRLILLNGLASLLKPLAVSDFFCAPFVTLLLADSEICVRLISVEEFAFLLRDDMDLGLFFSKGFVNNSSTCGRNFITFAIVPEPRNFLRGLGVKKALLDLARVNDFFVFEIRVLYGSCAYGIASISTVDLSLLRLP